MEHEPNQESHAQMNSTPINEMYPHMKQQRNLALQISNQIESGKIITG